MSISETVKAIRSQLDRLNWLATDSNPCAFLVEAEPELPEGWVRIYDDHGEVFGDADEILNALCLEPESEDEDSYGSCLQEFLDHRPMNSNRWPCDLIEVEKIVDGLINENPLCLITVRTNDGIKYAAGPHGVSQCALSDFMGEHLFGPKKLASSREQALQVAATGLGPEEWI